MTRKMRSEVFRGREKIDKEGYDFIKEEFGLQDEEIEDSKRGIIGTCAIKESLGDRNA